MDDRTDAQCERRTMTRRRCPHCGVPRALRVRAYGTPRCVRNCGSERVVRAAIRDPAALLPPRPSPAIPVSN
jgi:hypothetical protein